MKYYGSDRRPSKNSLQHWKYIKREKVGDKWKYYYDYDQLKSDAGKAASNVADKVSSTARNVASNVQKQVDKATGVTAKQNYQQTKTNYEDRLSKEAALDAERRKKAEASYVSARDKRDNAGLVSKAMFGKEMNANVKKASDRINAEDKNAQERRARTIAERDKAVGDAEKAYRKTLVGKTDAAKDTIEGAYDSSAKAVKKGAKAVGNVAKKVGNVVSDAANDAKEYVTGREAKKDLSKATQKREISKAGNMDLAVASNRGDTKHRVPGKKAKMESARKAYEEDKANEARAQKAYDKTLPGRIASGAKKVGNAAKKAGDAVSDAASDAKNWASEKVSDLSKSASKTVDAGKDFLDGLFGKRKKKKG